MLYLYELLLSTTVLFYFVESYPYYYPKESRYPSRRDYLGQRPYGRYGMRPHYESWEDDDHDSHYDYSDEHDSYHLHQDPYYYESDVDDYMVDDSYYYGRNKMHKKGYKRPSKYYGRYPKPPRRPSKKYDSEEESEERELEELKKAQTKVKALRVSMKSLVKLLAKCKKSTTTLEPTTTEVMTTTTTPMPTTTKVMTTTKMEYTKPTRYSKTRTTIKKNKRTRKTTPRPVSESSEEE